MAQVILTDSLQRTAAMEFHVFPWLLKAFPCPGAYYQPSYSHVPNSFACADL